jgi:hypothetical protein
MSDCSDKPDVSFKGAMLLSRMLLLMLSVMDASAMVSLEAATSSS